MKISEERIRRSIAKEIKRPKLGLVQQFLEIHSITESNDGLLIARIKRERSSISVYTKVVGQPFYAVFSLNPKTAEVDWFYTEAYVKISFVAISKSIPLTKLLGMTKLEPTKTVAKGEDIGTTKKSIKSAYSYFKICCDEADSFENNLKRLLKILERDAKGIRKLASHAATHINVVIKLHNDNGMIGGPEISAEHVAKLKNLSLGVSFDIYLHGNSLR